MVKILWSTRGLRRGFFWVNWKHPLDSANYRNIMRLLISWLGLSTRNSRRFPRTCFSWERSERGAAFALLYGFLHFSQVPGATKSFWVLSWTSAYLFLFLLCIWVGFREKFLLFYWNLTFAFAGEKIFFIFVKKSCNN